MLDVGHLLGDDRAGLEELAVTVLAGANRLDLLVLAGDLAVEVGSRGLDGDERVTLGPHGLLPRVDLGQFGEGAAAVRGARKLGVHLCEFEQLALHGGFGLHGAPRIQALLARTVHGSVHSVDT